LFGRNAQIARSGLAVLAPEPHRTTLQRAVKRRAEAAMCVCWPRRRRANRSRRHMCRYGAPAGAHVVTFGVSFGAWRSSARSAVMRRSVLTRLVGWVAGVVSPSRREYRTFVCGWHRTGVRSWWTVADPADL